MTEQVGKTQSSSMELVLESPKGRPRDGLAHKGQLATLVMSVSVNSVKMLYCMYNCAADMDRLNIT